MAASVSSEREREREKGGERGGGSAVQLGCESRVGDQKQKQ